MPAAWSALTVVLALLVLAGPGPASLPLLNGVILLLSALLLELTAVAMPGMGFFSAAPACYLALALISPKAALLAAILCLTLRTAAPPQGHRLLSALADLLPLTAALAAFVWLAPAVGASLAPAFLLLDLYLPASWLLPELLAGALDREERQRWGRFQHRTRLAWFALRVAAPALLTTPVGGLLLVPGLMALQWAARRALISYRAEEREELRDRLERTQLAAAEVREQQQRTRRDLAGAIEESLLKEELARELARSSDYHGRLETTLRLTRSLVPCRSAVIFEENEGALVPVAFHSPLAARLEGSQLLQADEPIVRQALASGRATRLEAPGPTRLMEGESVALAVPLDHRTALYVGLAAGELTSQQQRLLGVLAGVVGPGLEPAREVDRLAREATRSQALESSLDRLDQVLEATRVLGATLDRHDLLRALGDSAARLVAHSSRQFVESTLEEAPEVARAVAESGRPLLIDDLQTSRFPPLAPGETSLLAIPLKAENQLQGVLLLGRRQAFTREELDQLELLALHAALALSNVQAYERLRQSEAQLVQSSKLAAVGQLAAGVAHELNTPLGAIVLALDTLEKKPSEKALSIARDAARQARSIVEKLLYYSREGRVGRQPTDLNQVVRDTLLLIGNQLRIDQVQVVCHLGEIPEVEASPNEMQQVVTNLILNARDALLEGRERQVTVTTGVRPTGEVFLEVQDRGPGISPEVAPRIFDPFFTTKPVGRGTGLGLSVSSQIVAAHGGRLELLNPGQPGACFGMTLPA
ncbi:MAG: hypothetical protein AMXMBFR33_38340 [Candidatus Xenobia bacterium]